MTTPRRTLIGLLLTAVSLGAPVPSSVAQSGVVTDPDSPSGKEYAIPLEAARRDAAPSGGDAADDSSSPLFGAGVGDDSADEGGDAAPDKDVRATRRRGQRRTVDDSSGGRRSKGREPVLGSSRPVAASLPAGDGSATLTIAAVALSVLLLGGVGGSIVRRRQT